MAAWQKGDILCLAVDVPLRTYAIRVVPPSSTRRPPSDWVHFAFPSGCGFTDATVTPAITLQPGVVLEVLPDLGSFGVGMAPGPGFLPVVAREHEFVQFDSGQAERGATAVYGMDTNEMWGLEQRARKQHHKLATSLHDKVATLLDKGGLTVDADALAKECAAPGLTIEETAARAALDIRCDRTSSLGPFLCDQLVQYASKCANEQGINWSDDSVHQGMKATLDAWTREMRKLLTPDVRQEVRRQQEEAANKAKEIARKEQIDAKEAVKRYQREEAQRIKKEEEAEAEAERNRPPPTIAQRRVNEGGQTGFLTITLAWDTQDDLDLHCKLPHGGGEIFYSHTKVGGGELDVDANANSNNLMAHPVENIFFASKPAAGDYMVDVNLYDSRTRSKVKYQLAIEIGGAIQEFHGWVMPSADMKRVQAVKITIPPGNKATGGIVTPIRAEGGF